MIIILINTIITNIVIYSFGFTFFSFFFKEQLSKDNLSEIPLFGIIFLSFFAVGINFFFPINKTVGTGILIFGILNFIFIFKGNQVLIKKILKNLLLVSFISYLLLSFSNIYRPDAGLYHLPFISMINENKIIIGSVNINFRYAITSIAQYLSATQNNYIFDLRSISIPIASIFSFSILFMFNKFKKSLKSENNLTSFLFFLITCYSLISFGRFSNYGNDSISHLFFLILIIFIINNYRRLFFDIKKFNKITLISIFLFSTKPFMLIILTIPFIILIFNKNLKKIFQNKTSYIFGSLFLMWIIRTILISGCVIYPLEELCIKNLQIYDHNQTILEANSGEAWAKDWVNQKEKIEYAEYNKNFNWLDTWKENHLKKIIEKIQPFLFFLVILTLILLHQNNKKTNKVNHEIIFIFSLSSILTLVWFLKFPLYRYGSSFIATFIISTYILLVNFMNCLPDNKKFYKSYHIFIIICFLVFLSKNIIRIYKNINEFNNKQWPDIYSVNNDYEINKFNPIYKDNEKIYFFSNGFLCMYSASPCSNYKINNLNKKEVFTYKIYWKN